MRLSVATLGLALHGAPGTLAQTCPGVAGGFTLTDLTGTCDYGTLLAEYTRQVFDAAGATAACAADDGGDGGALTAKEDLDRKLTNATGAATGEEGGAALCWALYDTAEVTPFTRAADKGDDLHFEQMFYNGLSDWQDEVETLYEGYDGARSSYLEDDAAKVKEFYEGEGSYSRVAWPDALTNFDQAACTTNSAMCCWPKDRQANDNNGNCATPYDEECVDKDPGDNTNLCFADLHKGGASSGFGSDRGFTVFPEDNDDGEGSIHCHGIAWADDEYHHTARYKANNLFFVSMYDHMYTRGYVKNIPGMPMCGCLDQMPIVTQSDCSQVDLTEDWEVTYDGAEFHMHMTRVEIAFNSCTGRNNHNNDLWAYAARLYDDGAMSAAQFGKVGRVLTDDHDCLHAVKKAKHDKGYVTGYVHEEATWTHVAGRDGLYRGEPVGRQTFNKALFEGSVTAPPDLDVEAFDAGADPSQTPVVHRICPHCIKTHQNIYYRRLTPVVGEFNILNDILRRDKNDAAPNNVWGVDFTLHSTYEDAQFGAHPWKCENDSFNYRKAFTGDCSPSGERESDQHSNWWWTPGPQPDVAFYVNEPQDEGLTDYIEPGADRTNGETDADIGNFGKAGNTLELDGTYHITGAGADIWGYEDSFHYLSQPWGGDIDVKVHMSEYSNTANKDHSKGGLMLRSDNSPNAEFVDIMLSHRKGVNFQYRRSKGNHAGNSVNRYEPDPVITAAWMRLVKKQELVEFYLGDEAGETWTLHATETIFFPNDQYRVGLAITSQHRDYLAEATFTGYEIQAYEFPTSAPSLSAMPTVYDPVMELDTQKAGSHTVDDTGLETFKGSGTGLWGHHDSFFFHGVQRNAAGDYALEMEIKSFGNYELNSRGGLMIRDALETGAANAFVGAAGSRQGAVFQSRAAAGEKTHHHQMIWVNNNNYMHVRLVKVGSVVTASFKGVDEGDEWQVLGAIELTLTGDNIFIGRAVSAGRDYAHALETMTTTEYTITDL